MKTVTPPENAKAESGTRIMKCETCGCSHCICKGLMGASRKK